MDAGRAVQQQRPDHPAAEKLEAEDHLAPSEEQNLLSRYVG